MHSRVPGRWTRARARADECAAGAPSSIAPCASLCRENQLLSFDDYNSFLSRETPSLTLAPVLVSPGSYFIQSPRPRLSHSCRSSEPVHRDVLAADAGHETLVSMTTRRGRYGDCAQNRIVYFARECPRLERDRLCSSERKRGGMTRRWPGWGEGMPFNVLRIFGRDGPFWPRAPLRPTLLVVSNSIEHSSVLVWNDWVSFTLDRFPEAFLTLRKKMASSWSSTNPGIRVVCGPDAFFFPYRLILILIITRGTMEKGEFIGASRTKRIHRSFTVTFRGLHVRLPRTGGFPIRCD